MYIFPADLFFKFVVVNSVNLTETFVDVVFPAQNVLEIPPKVLKNCLICKKQDSFSNCSRGLNRAYQTIYETLQQFTVMCREHVDIYYASNFGN